MLINVLLPAFAPAMILGGCFSFKRRDACTYTRGSVRRASGFVLTGNPEVDGVDQLSSNISLSLPKSR